MLYLYNRCFPIRPEQHIHWDSIVSFMDLSIQRRSDLEEEYLFRPFTCCDVITTVEVQLLLLMMMLGLDDS